MDDPGVVVEERFAEPLAGFDEPFDLGADDVADEAFDDGFELCALPFRELTAEESLDFVFGTAESDQRMANLVAAAQMFAIRDAFVLARQNPWIYVPYGAADSIPGVDDTDFAVRSVAFDLGQRLHVSENLVHALAHQADMLTDCLPQLRELFTSGRISGQHVRAAVESATGITDETVLADYDQRLSLVAEGLRAGEFASRCRKLRERLCADSLQDRHDTARAKRRVTVEPGEDGMSWISAYIPTVDAARADVRLSATATRMRHEKGETRTKEQLRADAFIAWLCGDGTPTAAKARPVILIDDTGRYAEVLGYGPIDPRCAARALRDAPSFRKVFTDPTRPANLVLDRTTYRPSQDQRLWLTIRYGLDDDATPFLAPDAEYDHIIEYQHGGTTDVSNLVPLKPRLHRLKTVTRIRLDPKPDGGIRVRTPTGYDSDPPPF